MQSIFDQYAADVMDPETGKLHRSLAQGYVSMLVYEAETRKKLFRIFGKNTVVNDARMAAASAFANQPNISVSPAIPVGFTAWYYRCGYSDVGPGRQHWDVNTSTPQEAPFTLNDPLPQFDPNTNDFTPGNGQEFFHTQAVHSLASMPSLHYVGPSLELEDPAAGGNPSGNPAFPTIEMGVQYPFNSDPHAVRLYIDLPGGISTGAVFDTVEIILQNGLKFAHRWSTSVTKQAQWGLAIEHLVLF